MNEIIGIVNLPTDISNEVIFCSPNFTVKNSYEKTGGSSGGRPPPMMNQPLMMKKKRIVIGKLPRLSLQKLLCPLLVLMAQKRRHRSVQTKKGCLIRMMLKFYQIMVLVQVKPQSLGI